MLCVFLIFKAFFSPFVFVLQSSAIIKDGCYTTIVPTVYVSSLKLLWADKLWIRWDHLEKDQVWKWPGSDLHSLDSLKSDISHILAKTGCICGFFSLVSPSSRRPPAAAACCCVAGCQFSSGWRSDARAGRAEGTRCGPAGPPRCTRGWSRSHLGSFRPSAPRGSASCCPSAPEQRRWGEISGHVRHTS